MTNAAPRRRRLSEEARHTLIGAAVMAVLAALFLLSARTDGGAAANYRVTARFPSAEGIFVDSPVRLAGIDIGRVAGMAYESASQRTVLTLEIRDEIELPDDSIAIVTSEGMLGGRFIRLDPGGSLDLLGDGDAIEYTQGSIQFEELLAKVILAVERKRRAGKADSADEPAGAGQ